MQQQSGKRSRATPILDKAIAAVARHPEKSNNALAAETGISFQTVARARQWLKLAPSRAVGRRSKSEPPQDPDEAATWPRAKLIAMDRDFRAAMESAIARRLERVMTTPDAADDRAA
jgi:hypothetical protein